MHDDDPGDISSGAIFREVAVDALRMPSRSEVTGEDAWWLPYRDYWPIADVTWTEATECLEWERDVLRRLSERSHAVLESFLDTLDDEEVVLTCNGLDIGVGGAVLGLAAAGCATLVSCSGHFGEGKWSAFPVVQFAADRPRAELLLAIAGRADVGLTNTSEGLLRVWASDVDQMMEFASETIAFQEKFDALPASF